MHKIVVWCLLAFSPLVVMGADGEEDSQYKGWCTRIAAAEMIPMDERENYIRECLAYLDEADKRPDSSSRRRKFASRCGCFR